MSNQNEETKRICLTVTEDTHEKFLRLVPWGMRSNVLNCILTQLMNDIEKDGRLVYLDVISGDFQITCTGLGKTGLGKK